MTIEAETVEHLSERLDRLIEEQEAAFVARQPRSAAMLPRAEQSLAGGVTSSWQITRPQPVFLTHGAGSKVYDLDGNEYVDLHGGYGAGLAGHAHPAIVDAVRTQVGRGTHFAQPTEAAVAVAEELGRRWQLPVWRFANSGTEATMDAVHLMRSFTGRDLIVKVEGGYHGHHDSVQVSVCPEADEVGPPESPHGVPAATGIPHSILDLTMVVGFNDLDMVERVLVAHPGRVAGMILEPVMMNVGIIEPDPGYLAALKHLLHRHGALLTFDEVKTGLTAGPAGVVGLTGVVPDLVCLAKAIGGGVASAAVGGTEEVMAHVARGDYEMVGTFNGNPLAMAATRAMLESVATPAAYERLEVLRRRTRRRARSGDRGERGGRPRGHGGRQGVRGLFHRAGAGFPRLPRSGQPVQPCPLALAAQQRRVPPAVGQDGAVARVGAARRGRHGPVGRQLCGPVLRTGPVTALSLFHRSAVLRRAPAWPVTGHRCRWSLSSACSRRDQGPEVARFGAEIVGHRG